MRNIYLMSSKDNSNLENVNTLSINLEFGYSGIREVLRIIVNI